MKLLQLLSEIAVDLVNTLSNFVELRHNEISQDTVPYLRRRLT